jgi:hypothetical protein
MKDGTKDPKDVLFIIAPICTRIPTRDHTTNFDNESVFLYLTES